jgi:hypothetical protein
VAANASTANTPMIALRSRDFRRQLVAQGYRLELVSGHSVASQDRFAAIWTK